MRSVSGLRRNDHLPQALLLEWNSRRHRVAEHGNWPQSHVFQHRRQLGVAIEPDTVAGVSRIQTMAGMHKAIVDQQRGGAWIEACLAQHIATGDRVPAAAKA